MRSARRPVSASTCLARLPQKPHHRLAPFRGCVGEENKPIHPLQGGAEAQSGRRPICESAPGFDRRCSSFQSLTGYWHATTLRPTLISCTYHSPKSAVPSGPGRGNDGSAGSIDMPILRTLGGRIEILTGYWKRALTLPTRRRNCGPNAEGVGLLSVILRDQKTTRLN